MIGFPWKIIAAVLAVVLVLAGAYEFGYRRGENHGAAIGAREVKSQDAKLMQQTVAALEAQFKAAAADEKRVQQSYDQWRVDHAAALAPVDAPVVRLCYYRAAAGGAPAARAGATADGGTRSTAAAGRRGAPLRPGNPAIRGALGPNIGSLFVALGALLDDTSAFARSCKAAGR